MGGEGGRVGGGGPQAVNAVERDEAGLDYAYGQVVRFAHVVRAVQEVINEPVVRHDAVAHAYRELRATIAAALDDQQLTDPYGLAAVLEGENAQMRRALRRIRDGDEPTEPEFDAADDAMGGDLPDYPPDFLVIAAACLAELDPLAPEPDPAPAPRPVVDLPLPEPENVHCLYYETHDPHVWHPYPTVDTFPPVWCDGTRFRLPEPEEGTR